MRTIRRSMFRHQRRMFLAVFSLILVATLSYIVVINPLFSYAESQYMTATIVDDNGTVDFSPGIDGAVADMSFSNDGAWSVKTNVYDLKITLNNLPMGEKKLETIVSAGMVWIDDGASDENLRAQLNPEKYENGIQKTELAHEPILNYTFPNSGSRTYYLAEGVTAVTFNLKIGVDTLIDLDSVTDAFLANLYINDVKGESAHLSVSAPQGRNPGGCFNKTSQHIYVKSGETHQSYENYYRRIYYTLIKGRRGVKRLVKESKITMTVDDPAMKIVLTTNSSNTVYSIDNSRADEGVYVITRTPSVAIEDGAALPYAVVIPEDAEPGKIYTVTSTGDTVSYQVEGVSDRVPFTNRQVVQYEVLPNEEDVTIGWDSKDPSNVGSAHDTRYNSTVYADGYSQGMLGVGYINNRGSEDSAPKRMRMEFDTSVLGVMGVGLACEPRKNVSTVHVETKSGVSKDVELNKRCNNTGYLANITYSDFGLERYDYISKIEYDVGVVPAGTQLTYDSSSIMGFAYVGKLLRDDVSGEAKIEVFNQDNAEVTTGVATITTTKTKVGSIDIVNIPSTQVVNAGDSLNFAATIEPWAAGPLYNTTVRNPIIYIRQEVKDVMGNFLPISSLKITTGSGRGGEDITHLFGQIAYEDTETARVYKIDGRNVTNGKAGLFAVYIGEDGKWYGGVGFKISWSINTNITTPDQQYNIANLIFAQDPDTTSSMRTHSRRGDPFNLSGSSNNTVYPSTADYYQIRGWTSIGVENAGKHTSSDGWLTWSEGSNPITIGSSEGSLVDMKATMINNSGVEVAGPTTIYFPIPKKDQNWGSLSYENKAFEFSTALTGAISNSDNEHFEIAYGKNVTPTDSGTDLDNEASKFTTDTTGWTNADWEAVNCIKITASNIPANQPGTVDSYDFIYKLKVTDAANASDGALDTWRPIYFQQLTNSAGDVFAGWYKGSYVSIKLADGKIFGQLFVDANENGKKDADEQELKEAGWQLDLYDKVSNKLVRSTATDTDGKYSFAELSLDADSYYVTVTNKYPINSTNASYLFTIKGATSSTGAYNTDNQAEGSKTTTPVHTTAYIGPISPSQTTGEATYNIGLVEYVANETYTGKVSFDDQDNAYTTRPSTVTITATATDGTTQDIIVNVLGNDITWSRDFPKYNSRGEKQTWTFTIPDQTGYIKTDETEDDGYTYNTTYKLKKVTLTTHHYKEGTTDKLADDVITTLYWNQDYTAAKAVLADYDYVSSTGDAISDKVAKDSLTVNHYYRLRTSSVTTHYYIKDTTTKIADDVVETKNYTENYETHPLVTIPAAYQNYELVSDQPEGYKGIVSRPSIEVIYYYQKKDAELSSEIKFTAPETIDNKKANVDYELGYTANIKDYIGPTKVTITLKLPYALDEENSELDGATYDAETKTLTWVVTKNHNSYIDGEELAIAHQVFLIYDGASANDLLLATAEVTVELDGKDNDAADSAETQIKTPARIVYRFVDENGQEVREKKEEDGFVGDKSNFTPPEIPDYKLVEAATSVPEFSEEDQVITYRYEKLPNPINPKTFDSNLAIYFILSGALVAMLGCIGYGMNKRKV